MNVLFIFRFGHPDRLLSTMHSCVSCLFLTYYYHHLHLYTQLAIPLLCDLAHAGDAARNQLLGSVLTPPTLLAYECSSLIARVSVF